MFEVADSLGTPLSNRQATSPFLDPDGIVVQGETSQVSS